MTPEELRRPVTHAMRQLSLFLCLLAGCSSEPLPPLPAGMHYVRRSDFGPPLILRRDEMTGAELYLAGVIALPDKYHCVRRGLHGRPFLMHEDDMTPRELQAVRWNAARRDR